MLSAHANECALLVPSRPAFVLGASSGLSRAAQRGTRLRQLRLAGHLAPLGSGQERARAIVGHHDLLALHDLDVRPIMCLFVVVLAAFSFARVLGVGLCGRRIRPA